MIEVNELVKAYKDVKAVNGINLHIKEGEIYGLLGPNGAGKSTTLNALLGLITVDAGTVKIMGTEFHGTEAKIKRCIGYVPQDLAFFEQLSGYDNVIYWGRIFGLKGQALKDAVKEALEFTGLWDRRKEKAKNYSGGMKRRLNIACAIVHKPKILLMDEPTVGVDPQSRNSILEAIKELNREGNTVIYTSHYMEEVEAICSRVGIIDYGKVIAEGTVNELVDSITTERIINLECDADVDTVTNLINGIDGIISCKYENESFQITTPKDKTYLSKVLECLLKHDIEVNSTTVEKFNLETVFLRLTGKKLRD